MKYAFFCVLALFCCALLAEDITIAGKVYKNASVTGCTANGLTLDHSAGITTIAVKDWPKEREADLKKWQPEIEKKKIQKRAEEVRKELNRRGDRYYVKVLQVLGDGRVLAYHDLRDISNDTEGKPIEEKVKHLLRFAKKRYCNMYYAQYRKMYKDDYAKKYDKKEAEYYSSIHAYNNTVHEISQDYENIPSIILIEDVKDAVVDGQKIAVFGWETGTYQYQTVNGSASTVKKYTADMIKAADHYNLLPK